MQSECDLDFKVFRASNFLITFSTTKCIFQVGNFGIFWISYFLTQLTAIGVAFTFGALCPTIDFANGAVPSFGGTLMFFGR